jgi:hypothetical protein
MRLNVWYTISTCIQNLRINECDERYMYPNSTVEWIAAKNEPFSQRRRCKMSSGTRGAVPLRFR